MIDILENYIDEIRKLNTFEKSDIMNCNFMLYSDNNIEIFYAPHNEIVNEDAKIFIVGITPGWQQTRIAYKTAKDAICLNDDITTIKRKCKRNSRFAGNMRKNIIEMLDELNLNEKLNIESCSSLFKDKDYLLHTTSIIPYPVFVNGKNYTGSNPKILKNEILTLYMKKYFIKEIKKLPNALIIPLGKSVEEILLYLVDNNIIKKNNCLFGFPHPSGANGHRRKFFDENKKNMMNIISNLDV